MTPLQKDIPILHMVLASHVKWPSQHPLCCIESCETDSMVEIIQRLCVRINQLEQKIEAIEKLT